jgi:hypothetical protein
MTSSTSVDLSFKHREMVILGAQYAGEMKKGVFSLMNYWLPKRGILSLHSGCNEGAAGDVTLFFGLSGTGKTTLSADPARPLIGDDEHGWGDAGVFNVEGGCYAKAIGLRREAEPEIFEAVRFGAVLENVVFDEDRREVDYDNASITENTRACYPIEFIANAKVPCVGGHPRNIIMLCCDAFGVLPPVARLAPAQVCRAPVPPPRVSALPAALVSLRPPSVCAPLTSPALRPPSHPPPTPRSGDVLLHFWLHGQGRGHRDGRDRARGDLLRLLRLRLHGLAPDQIRVHARGEGRAPRDRGLARQHGVDVGRVRDRCAVVVWAEGVGGCILF